MSHPSKQTAMIRKARETGTFTRVEIPRTTCERCGREVYAEADGGPRGHMVPTQPCDDGHSELVPTMRPCGDE